VRECSLFSLRLQPFHCAPACVSHSFAVSCSLSLALLLSCSYSCSLHCAPARLHLSLSPSLSRGRGGTAIEAWMTPASLASCGEQASGFGPAPDTRRNPDPGLLTAFMDSGELASAGLPESAIEYRYGGCPTIHSTLWNSMIAPLTVLRVSGFLWYQGERVANSSVRVANSSVVRK
jgi:hypothetical protein